MHLSGSRILFGLTKQRIHKGRYPVPLQKPTLVGRGSIDMAKGAKHGQIHTWIVQDQWIHIAVYNHSGRQVCRGPRIAT
jgi:hypothetical protein